MPAVRLEKGEQKINELLNSRLSPVKRQIISWQGGMGDITRLMTRNCFGLISVIYMSEEVKAELKWWVVNIKEVNSRQIEISAFSGSQ